MGRPIKDLTGKQFGRLTVLRRAEDYIKPNGKREPQWICRCSCEEDRYVTVIGNHLKNGNTRSCGCLRKEIASSRLSNMLKKYNRYDLSGEYGIGWTSNTNKEFYFDLEDYDKIKDYCWSEHIDSTNYHSLQAWDCKIKKLIKMHFLLIGKYCDHKNRNSLDNRKSNLRKATLSENAQNRSIYKNNTSGIMGVALCKSKKLWEATIKVNGNTIRLGKYSNKEYAVKARLEAEYEYYGDFAPQQNLFDQYGVIHIGGVDINE